MKERSRQNILKGIISPAHRNKYMQWNIKKMITAEGVTEFYNKKNELRRCKYLTAMQKRIVKHLDHIAQTFDNIRDEAEYLVMYPGEDYGHNYCAKVDNAIFTIIKQRYMSEV
jgi:hypothetical protein